MLYTSLDLLRARLFVPFLSVLFGLHACQAPLLEGEALLDLDYYFGPDFVQIQGKARLPAVVQKSAAQSGSRSISPVEESMNRENNPRFLTYGERRQLCRKIAVKNAHSKWLSITERKWLPQSEWHLLMRLGEKSAWNDCLNEAKILETFYDLPNRCRLQVRYKCDPRNY